MGGHSPRPFVTVVVPVRNEARHIERTLRGLLTQRYPLDRFEVILCDGQSTDATLAIARRVQAEFDNLRILYNPRRLSSAARNLGVQHARGEVVLVVDGHCEVRDPKYLARLADTFVRTGADSVGRPQPLWIASASRWQRAVALARHSPAGHNPDSFIYSDRGQFVPPQSVAVAYRREVFERVGPFDERFDACEDVEYNTRVAAAGLTCYFEPRLALPYVPRDSLAGLLHQLGRYGRGRWRLFRKWPASLRPPTLAPAGLLAWFLASAVGGLVWPTLACLFCLSVLGYAALVLLASACLARRSADVRVLAWLPLVFVAIHFGFGLGLLAEAFRLRWHGNWRFQTVVELCRRPINTEYRPSPIVVPTGLLR